MGKAANVRAIRALTELRNALGRFGREAQEALASAEIEIRRTQEWLREREAYWQREVEKARRAAEAAGMRMASLYPAAPNGLPCNGPKPNSERRNPGGHGWSRQ